MGDIIKYYSIWKENVKKNSFDKLSSNKKCDVLIIGGGITGISSAYQLINKGLNVILVERNEIGGGITSRTTGKLTYLQNLIYSTLNNKYSYDIAYKYLNSQMDAINIVKNVILENNIDCNLDCQDSFLFTNNKDNISKIEEEKKVLERMGVVVNDKDKINLNIPYCYGISVSDTYYFHPVKYIQSLASICFNNGIEIYEHTKVMDIKKREEYYECILEECKVYAKNVILASHYPYFIKPFLFPIKAHIEKSYILADKVSDYNNISGISIDKDITSFRYYKDKDNYLIYLYGTHNLAYKFNYKSNFDRLINSFNINNKNIKYIWSNTDIVTSDGLPYIGKISDNLYIGTGYNGWGMTNGTIAGMILSDLILGRENKYASLFDPLRKSIYNIAIFGNVFNSMKPFIQNKVIKNKKYYSDNVVYMKRNGKNIAIYTDKLGKEHIVYSDCPHLKCSLVFNEVEKTWDCPCHASKFDIDGNCINGPSNYNIRYNNDKE